MARLPAPGSDHGVWGDILNEFLSQSLAASGELKSDSVGSAQLKENSVTNDAIAPNTITNAEIATNAVNAASISDGSITEALLDTNLQAKINAIETPDWSDIANKPEVVTLNGTQTLTNKTLTSPVVSGSTAFDTNTLYVNATNHRVGVGTTSPSGTMHVYDSETSLILEASVNNRKISFFPSQGALDSTNTAFHFNRNSSQTVAIGYSSASHFRVGQATEAGLFGSTALTYLGNTEAALPLLVMSAAPSQTADLLQLRSSNSVTNGDLLTVNSSGRLGIATAAPTHSLTLSSTATGVVMYNTADQVTNYERIRTYWAGNVATITTEAGGTGVARQLRLIANTRTFTIDGSGTHFEFLSSTSGAIPIVRIQPTLNTTAGLAEGLRISPQVNQSSTAAYTALLINPTETSTGSGAKNLIDAQVGGVSKFKVDNSGLTTVATPTSASHATTKDYVDTVNASKVDRTTAAYRVYGTNDSGGQGAFTYSGGADGGTFAYRLSGGTLSVGAPTSGAHATTKTYVDNALVAKADVANGQLSGVSLDSEPAHSTFTMIPSIYNDLNFLDLRGGIFTTTKDGMPYSFGGVGFNAALRPDVTFAYDDSVTTSTVHVITIDNIPSSWLRYNTTYGIVMTAAYRARNVKIEVFFSGAWTEIHNITGSTSGVQRAFYASNGTNGVTGIRYTLTNYTNTTARITSLFAINYQGPMASASFLPRNGGALYAPLRHPQYATSSRPSAASSGAGAEIYDTTLNKPLWSDGTNWRDSVGAIV